MCQRVGDLLLITYCIVCPKCQRPRLINHRLANPWIVLLLRHILNGMIVAFLHTFGRITYFYFLSELEYNSSYCGMRYLKYWLVENGLRKDTIPIPPILLQFLRISMYVDVSVIICTYVPRTYRSLSVLTFPSPCVRETGQLDPPLFAVFWSFLTQRVS